MSEEYDRPDTPDRGGARTEATGPRDETFFDRIGIPHSLRWGFLAVLIFMTGNGTESNFISPHIGAVLGTPASVVATIISLFAFAFLVWVNITTPVERNGVAVGWFSVMFTGGLPTLGSLFALGMIPAFGGGVGGETAAMIGSTVLVVVGFLVAWFAVRDPRGTQRIAPEDETTGQVLTAGLRLSVRRPKIFAGFLVRLINTAPQYGMFIILPTVIADERGWGQSRWLTMTVFVYATNILVNAVFGAVGDRWGWRRTVQWFGVLGSAIGLLLWWYVPQLVPAGSAWGFWVSVLAGCLFGCLLAGFVPMGAIMPALAPEHKGAAMAMYTTAAGGAAFLGGAVVALVLAVGLGNASVVWAFVVLYAVAFVLMRFLNVPQDDRGVRQH